MKIELVTLIKYQLKSEMRFCGTFFHRIEEELLNSCNIRLDSSITTPGVCDFWEKFFCHIPNVHVYAA